MNTDGDTDEDVPRDRRITSVVAAALGMYALGFGVVGVSLTGPRTSTPIVAGAVALVAAAGLAVVSARLRRRSGQWLVMPENPLNQFHLGWWVVPALGVAGFLGAASALGVLGPP